MLEHHSKDARTDFVTAGRVEEGLRLSLRYGIHPALLFMEEMGVPRPVALRVLCSPQHYRQRDRRSAPRPLRHTLS